MNNEDTPILIDSHCHLNHLDLNEFGGDLNTVLAEAEANGVQHMLCVCTELNDLPDLHRISEKYSNISISVGIHPNTDIKETIDATKLELLAAHLKCIAIGETGLDYYRTTEASDQLQQKERFREHIRAALRTSKPLIIHTRQAAEDTLLVMSEENAQDIGGVMHCFSENWDVARRALDLNFYISFSGILTFKNAVQLQEVAKKVPLDRILIETDAPYLAPTPFRGKQNHPALVKYVALALSNLRDIPYEAVAYQTTNNFYRCFRQESVGIST